MRQPPSHVKEKKNRERTAIKGRQGVIRYLRSFQKALLVLIKKFPAKILFPKTSEWTEKRD